MSTGFGYVRDSKPNIINWADIGKQMSDAISADLADRQGRKDDIAKQDAEYAKSLLDQPQGSYEETNRFISDCSQQAAQQALRDLQALKSGVISEQEYYQRRANLKSGTDLMFTAGKKFNENYGAAMESIKNGESSVLLADLKGKMEGYLNFANSGAYINPLTASVNVSTRDKDGNISSKPGDFMTASELVNLSTEDFAKFKLDDTIKNISDALGKITYRDAQGRTITASTVNFDLLDKNDQKKFQNKFDGAIDDQVNAIVGGNNSKIAASILADYSDEDYELSFDLNETDPNKIVYDPKGNVVLTDDQLKKAKEIVKTRLRSQLDATILEGLPNTPTRTRLTSGERQADSVYRLAYNLTTGFETDSTLKKIAGLQDNIDRIVDGDQEYVIQFKRDPKTGLIPNNKIIPKIFTNDVFDAEESAVALTRAIDSRIELADAENAKERYFVNNKKRSVMPSEGFGEFKTRSLTDIFSVEDASKTIKNKKNIFQKLEDIDPNEGREVDIKKVIESMPDGKEKKLLERLNFISNDPGVLDADNLIISNIPDNIYKILTVAKLKSLGVGDPKITKAANSTRNANEIEIDYESGNDNKAFAALLNEIVKSSNVKIDAFGNPIL